MNDKSTIRYWLRQPGEDSDSAVQLISTQTVSVPKVGEIFSIDTKFDKTWLEIRFQHLSEKQRKALTRDEESQVRGDFVVVDVKRWIKTQLVPVPADEAFGIENNSTSAQRPDVPIEIVREEFEVYIEPFRHTELTETSIAKLRNKMGSIYGYFQALKAFHEAKASDMHKDAMKVLLKDMEKQAIENIEDVVAFIKDDKNW